jgi:hypothetical protein
MSCDWDSQVWTKEVFKPQEPQQCVAFTETSTLAANHKQGRVAGRTHQGSALQLLFFVVATELPRCHVSSYFSTSHKQLVGPKRLQPTSSWPACNTVRVICREVGGSCQGRLDDLFAGRTGLHGNPV